MWLSHVSDLLLVSFLHVSMCVSCVKHFECLDELFKLNKCFLRVSVCFLCDSSCVFLRVSCVSMCVSYVFLVCFLCFLACFLCVSLSHSLFIYPFIHFKTIFSWKVQHFYALGKVQGFLKGKCRVPRKQVQGCLKNKYKRASRYKCKGCLKEKCKGCPKDKCRGASRESTGVPLG